MTTPIHSVIVLAWLREHRNRLRCGNHGAATHAIATAALYSDANPHAQQSAIRYFAAYAH